MTLPDKSDSGRARRVTVGEVREWLRSFDDDALLLVDGYEDGYDRPHLRTAEVSLERESEWRPYSGVWDDARYVHDGGPPEVAVILGRFDG